MRGWVWLLFAACSTPPPAQRESTVYVPPDDERTSVAWQAAHPKPIDAGLYWDEDWAWNRKLYDEVIAEPPGTDQCDWRATRRLRPGEPVGECYPQMYKVRAAYVRSVRTHDDAGVDLELDIGADDKLTAEWWGAGIDESGRLLTRWSHPHDIEQRRSFLTIRLPLSAAQAIKRVALDKSPPEDQRR